MRDFVRPMNFVAGFFVALRSLSLSLPAELKYAVKGAEEENRQNRARLRRNIEIDWSGNTAGLHGVGWIYLNSRDLAPMDRLRSRDISICIVW